MNQTRAFLLFAWVAVAILLVFEWNRFTAAPAQPVTAGSTASSPSTPAPAAGQDMPTLPQAADTPAATPALSATPTSTDVPAGGQKIDVYTDLLHIQIDTVGASIVGAELLRYPVELRKDSPNVQLLSDSSARFYVAQSGLLTASGPAAPTHTATYTAAAKRYDLRDGQASVSVPLTWIDPASGLKVTKTFTFNRGSYAIGLIQNIENTGSSAWEGAGYYQLQRVPPPPAPKHAMFTNPDSFSFVGAAWFSPEEKFEKRKFDNFREDGPLNRQVTGGWIAFLQHHFVSAWVPDSKASHTFDLVARDGNRYAISSVGPRQSLLPGKQTQLQSTLWVGPKIQDQLAKVDPNLPLTLDYGVLSFLAQPLFWVLDKLHGLFGNWGWAIIGIVVLLKILLFPLANAQYRSFAKMRAIQPRMESLKERYGEDRQKYQLAMMELYKKEKINPMGGCLPMLIPIPVFIALYWVLLESVELRQAPWMGWIQNLTAPDPLFILPVLNLITMYATQKLTPSPGMDPMQKKMLMAMPIVFGVMFAFFPAGLVLYWFTNGLLGLAQQWWMTKKHSSPATAAAK